ncbi:MAG: hypothetical protein ACP5GI_00115 [Sulfolobales archaeon]
MFYLNYKFYEKGLSAMKLDTRKTSIKCPVCGYVDKVNRASWIILKAEDAASLLIHDMLSA